MATDYACEIYNTRGGGVKVLSADGADISNIKAVVSPLSDLRMSPSSGILVSGTPDNKISDLTIENIDITLPEGGTVAHSKLVMPKNIDQYPEYSHFGANPVYGMFVRNAEVFNYKSINFVLSGDDARAETRRQSYKM